ncbi:hypothetical protein D3C72_1972130 [compost metagenome]
MPAAPATDSIDSTSGVPAANMVASVRVQRAITALRNRLPKIGSFSSARSVTRCTFSDFFSARR